MVLSQCYNSGCGQKFDPSTNSENACEHHPGQPIFHDAFKGWSCCKKRSTDFTEFLNIPGCTASCHSDIKPVAPEKPVQLSADEKDEVIVVAPPSRKPEQRMERPSKSEAKIALRVTVAPSLSCVPEKELEKLDLKTCETTEDGIKVGSMCYNGGCRQCYEGDVSLTNACTYHPGAPVFHEGMKYWSCCSRKTSDFTAFLQQAGCTTGIHLWVKPKTCEDSKQCRHDWHQTASHVSISIYSKNPVPNRCRFHANRVSCDVDIMFDSGASFYQESFVLGGVIDPLSSHVNLMGTKVELNLRKAESQTWPSLVMPAVNGK